MGKFGQSTGPGVQQMHIDSADIAQGVENERAHLTTQAQEQHQNHRTQKRHKDDIFTEDKADTCCCFVVCAAMCCCFTRAE
jgi:hypothetical protein